MLSLYTLPLQTRNAQGGMEAFLPHSGILSINEVLLLARRMYDKEIAYFSQAKSAERYGRVSGYSFEMEGLRIVIDSHSNPSGELGIAVARYVTERCLHVLGTSVDDFEVYLSPMPDSFAFHLERAARDPLRIALIEYLEE